MIFDFIVIAISIFLIFTDMQKIHKNTVFLHSFWISAFLADLQKLWKNKLKIYVKNRLKIDSIFNRFLIDFEVKNDLKIDQKSIKFYARIRA